MRKNKIMAYALAGAMAVSNLGALAIPMTAFAAAVPTTAVVDKASDGEDVDNSTPASSDDDLYAQVGKDYTATLTIEGTDATEVATTDASGLVDANKVVMTVTPSTLADCVSLDLSEATITKGVEATTQFKLDKVKLKVNGSKTASLKTTDIINVVITYKDAVGDIAAPAYLIHPVLFENPNDNMSVALYETDTYVPTAATYSDGEKDGRFTFYVAAAADTISGLTGKQMIIGAQKSGTVSAILDNSDIVSYANCAAGKYFLDAVSSDPNTVKVDNANNTKNSIRVLAGKTGSATVTVYLKKAGATTSPTADDVTTISTIAIPVTVKGISAAVAVYNEKNQAITTLKLTKDSSKSALSAGITPAQSGFDSDADIIWVSADENIAKVTGSGLTATVEALGNTVGTNVYAVASDDATYKTTYAAQIKAGKTVAEATLAAATAAGAKETIAVSAEGFDLVMSATEKIELFVNGSKSSAIVATVNDTKFAGNIAYNATPGQNAIKLTFKSGDEKIATVDEKGVVTPVAAGKTEITVTGTYKVSSTNGLVDTTITTTVPVTVIDNAELEAAAQKAAEDLAKAEADKKAAEDAATAAKADAAAQKTAAETATKEATAAKEAAAKAATAQKAAEDAAAAAEKKAADAAAAATGIKKGATKAVKGQTFKATSSKAVTLTKIKNAKTVTVGSVVEINNQVYKVTALGKGALKAGKATKLTVDAQFLTKKGINADCAKGTGKIKTLIIKNQTKNAAPAKALVKAVKKYNKKVKVQYK